MTLRMMIEYHYAKTYFGRAGFLKKGISPDVIRNTVGRTYAKTLDVRAATGGSLTLLQLKWRCLT
jgi:hypothetical protein